MAGIEGYIGSEYAWKTKKSSLNGSAENLKEIENDETFVSLAIFLAFL